MSAARSPLRVAVASSGLGHVARGIETWALDSARALDASGADVMLFAGAPISVPASGLRVEVLRSVPRDRADRITRWMPGFLWRWGLKSAYGLEQTTFWFSLWPRLRRRRIDVLHVQDPLVADWCRRFRRWGLVRTQEILAHGTEEPLGFLARLPCVQHLAPWHLEQSVATLRAQGTAADRFARWVAIPNFVDVSAFSPVADDEERDRARASLGLPSDAFIVGCVAAVKRHHKRIDHLLSHFAAFASDRCNDGRRPYLVVAGASTPDTEELRREAESLLPGQCSILTDLTREQMPGLYRCMDLFVLASLFEMMPIALLESLASGVPVVTNAHPVLEWMSGVEAAGPVGEAGEDLCGGWSLDMESPTALADLVLSLDAEALECRACGARRRVEQMYAESVVVKQMLAYYELCCRRGVDFPEN